MGWLRVVARYLRSVPVSVGFAVLLVLTTSVTGSLFANASKVTLHTWAVSVPTTFGDGKWWTIVTSFGIAPGPVQTAIAVVASLTLLGWSERMLGHRRTVLVLAITGVAGAGIGVLAQWVGTLVGEWWSAGTEDLLTLDPMIAIIGTTLAASAVARPLWRRRVRVVGFAALIVFALYDGNAADGYRVIAALVGLVLGVMLRRSKASADVHRSSHAETRTLLAIVVAICAIGPAVSAINPNGYGVMSLLGWVFGDPFPTAADVRDACSSETAIACAHDRAFFALRGPGPILMLFVPLVLLLISSYGLRKGRRFALWLAIGVNAVLAVVTFVSFVVVDEVQDGANKLSLVDVVQLVIWAGGPVVLPLAVIVTLLVKRRYFRLPTSRSRLVQFWVMSAAVFLACSTLYFVVANLNRATFTPAVDTSELLMDTPMRFVPVNFLVSTGGVYFPHDYLTRFVFHWVGPLFWIVVVVLLVRLLNVANVAAEPSAQAELRRLLARGSGTLGFMTTWDGNRVWFSADRGSAIGYRVVGDVAITVSDPICAAGREAEVVREFIRFCDHNSWTCAFYSVHDEYRRILADLGWESLPVGVETLIDPTTFSLSGKAWQSVRTAMNRGVKDGLRAEWTTYRALQVGMRLQIRELSEQWAADKELPEMGFTLGGLDELKDPEVHLMLAIGPGEELQAVTSWLPVYRDGVTVGWTLDVMRRSETSMPGVMEFVIASAALRMQEDGVELLSLSGAPLATAPTGPDRDPGEEPTIMIRVLQLLARLLEPAYGFSSLLKYKAKFRPEYRTLHMCYRDPLSLPTIGRALAGAYLPDVSRTQSLRLLRTLVAS